MLLPCLTGANSGQWIRALIPRRDVVTLSGPANVAIRELRPRIRAGAIKGLRTDVAAATLHVDIVGRGR